LLRVLHELPADSSPARELTLGRAPRALAKKSLRRLGVEIVRVPVPARTSKSLPDIRDDEFDSRFHSRRDSLPPGAEEYLRAENPRLRELRESYARLPWPVCKHSRWRDDTVKGWLNLKYFRGDNIIIWHHREGDDYARLFYFNYLGYILQCGGGSLVESLSEDGAFGCFVYDFPGYPHCSRDLLDSVNELLFLDRNLSLLSWSTVRILDIGAGYGRLAHRAAHSISGLTDYCCVDAVAESTYLSEYYTGFRGVAPPARVLALPDVPSLNEEQFDLAVNVHSFSECRLEAVDWWMSQVARLRVPYLFVVPNEASGFSTTEVDGTHRDYFSTIESYGYRLMIDVPTIEDAAVRDVLGVHDRFCLFERLPL
jgi:hypothetical protein